MLMFEFCMQMKNEERPTCDERQPESRQQNDLETKGQTDRGEWSLCGRDHSHCAVQSPSLILVPILPRTAQEASALLLPFPPLSVAAHALQLSCDFAPMLHVFMTLNCNFIRRVARQTLVVCACVAVAAAVAVFCRVQWWRRMARIVTRNGVDLNNPTWRFAAVTTAKVYLCNYVCECVCVMRECCVVRFRQPDKKLGVKVLIFWVLKALSVPGKKGAKASTLTLFPHDADTCSIQIACQSDDIDVPARHPPDCNCTTGTATATGTGTRAGTAARPLNWNGTLTGSTAVAWRVPCSVYQPYQQCRIYVIFNLRCEIGRGSALPIGNCQLTSAFINWYLYLPLLLHHLGPIRVGFKPPNQAETCQSMQIYCAYFCWIFQNTTSKIYFL